MTMMFKLKKYIKDILRLYLFSLMKRTVRDIQESIIKLKEYVRDIKKKELAYIQEYPFQENFPEYFRRRHPFSDINVYKMKNVCVDISNGLVYTKDKRFIFQESYGSLRKMFLWETIKPLKSPKIKLEGEYIYIPLKGFYHYLLEELPAILHAKELFPNASISYNYNISTKYYNDSLSMLFEKTDLSPQKKNFQSDSLIFTKHPEYSGFVNKYDLQVLNKYFAPYLSDEGQDNIYISRSATKNRAIANELEIEQYLGKKGYEVVHLERLNFKEQVQTISAAKRIISPHGAGLSHLCWNNRKKNVLEVFPSYIYNDCFARLAVMQGNDYSYIRCVAENGNELIPMEKIKEFVE